MKFTLTPSWIDTRAPLIYMWEIRDGSDQLVGRYIGKAIGGDTRPTKHYKRNVDRLRNGQPYRNGKNYRRVHVALAAAVEAGNRIVLSYLCNVPKERNIFEIENRYIREYRSNADDGIGLNGPCKGGLRLQVVRATASRASKAATPAPPELPDLEDFLEYVEAHYPELEARVGKGRCSVYIGKTRLLRAAQSGPRAKVKIKLVQSRGLFSGLEGDWDGTDGQLGAMIDGERKVYDARHR